MSYTYGEVHRARKAIENAAQSMPEDQVVESPWMLPEWKPGEVYHKGDRVRYGMSAGRGEDKPYRYIGNNPNDQPAPENWNPQNAPSLWAEILPGQDGSPVGEWTQPDSTNPYQIGDQVLHNGLMWTSVIDNNVWEPGVYGWQQQDREV